MHEKDGVYEYVAVYVDDLAFAMKDPKSFVETLTANYKFKLKGTGPLEFHLGCDFFRDTRMHDNYVRLFGEKAKLNVYSPLEKGDHPELDSTEFLGMDGMQRYQSLLRCNGQYLLDILILPLP
jgi:hypothetical protein